MTWSMGVALVVTIGAIAALIKRCETRLVLLSAGILMALLSLEPMIAFKQFDKSMTNATLIIAICSAMGFASVVSLTKCDVHLVALLTKPLKKLGLMLLPACMLVVSLILCHCSASSGRDPRLRKHLGAAAQDVGGYRHADRRYLCYRRHSYQPGRSD